MTKKQRKYGLAVFTAASLMIAVLTSAVSIHASGKKTVYVITKETHIQDNHTYVTNYKYNKNGLLNEVWSGKKSSQKIKYDKNKISELVTSEGKTKQTIKYTYNKNGRIKKILFRQGNGKYQTAIIPTYDNKGLVTKYKDWGHGNISLYYSGTDIKQSKDGNGAVIKYTYDKKKNTIKCVTEYDGDEDDATTFTFKYKGDRIIQRTMKYQLSGYKSSNDKEVYKYTTKKLSVPASMIKKIKEQQRKLINQEHCANPELYDFGQIALHV